MFNQCSLPSRGIPQGVNGMSRRSYSTTNIPRMKDQFPELDTRLSLTTITTEKKFVNPNFVNRSNPNVYHQINRTHYHPTTPVDIAKSSSDTTQSDIEIGVDVLDSVQNSENLMKVSPPIRFSISPKFVIAMSPESLPRKDRLISDCCSEDSFIVFECSNEDPFETDESEESETESEDESDVDDDETSADEVDFTPPSRTVKKVRFNDTPIVHKLVAWDFAYRDSRKGQWEQFGRDRYRFRTRIDKVEQKLRGIFDKNHRARIYNSRFSDFTLLSSSVESPSAYQKSESNNSTSIERTDD